MSSISVSHDRPEVINPLSWVLAFSQSGGTGVSLFAIVVKLGSEELGDFVGDSVGWIVYVGWCVRKRVNEAMVGGGMGTYRQGRVQVRGKMKRWKNIASQRRILSQDI